MATGLKAQPDQLWGIKDVAQLAAACQRNFEPLYKALIGFSAVRVFPFPDSDNQGSIWYSDGSSIAALAKDANATRYLSNTGTENNPAWAQVNLANGVTGTLPAGHGGTGVTTFGGTNQLLYTTATDTLSAIATANSRVLATSAGGVPSWVATLPAVNGSAVTNLNANNLASGLVSVIRGGTGIAAAALGDVLYGSGVNVWSRLTGNTTTTRKFLRQVGTGSASAAPAWDTIVIGDLPTITEVKGGTNQTTYTLGDILYSSAANTLAKLTGNTTTTKKFLTQTGNGAVSAAPAWGTLAMTDLPSGGAWALTSALTLSGAGLLFSADNTYDIGASGATRPRTLYLGTDLKAAGALFERGRTAANGTWENVVYNAADYTAATGTWTVDSGDVGQNSYSLAGKTAFWLLQVAQTSVSATPSYLGVAVPAAFSGGVGTAYCGYVLDNATATQATVSIVGTVARVQKADGTNWSTSTNNTWIYFLLVVKF